MNTQKKLLTLIMITCAIFVITLGTVIAQPRLTSQAKLTINSIGPVKVGMNLPEAAAAANVKLYVSSAGSDSCYYLEGEGSLEGVGFMITKDEVKSRQQYVTSDIIARIDIHTPQITTVSGAKIGDTEARIKSLYPGKIEVTQHAYNPKGHYLTFVPRSKAEQNYRVVFETDGQRVITYRSGKIPEVEYVEGCS